MPLSRMLGFALLFVALRAALSLDEQRVPPEVLRPPGERSTGHRPATDATSPEALRPRGDWRRAPGDVFAWQWSGPPIAWHVVLLDEDLMEVGRTGADDATADDAPAGDVGAAGTAADETTAAAFPTATTAVVPTAWERLLQIGASGYWMVEGVIEDEGGRRRIASAPVRFTIVR